MKQSDASKSCVTAFAFVLAGCAFIVDPPQLGSSCAFRGKGDECGDCIAVQCQTAVDAIDACCLEEQCGGLISLVEGCATAHDERCDAVRAAAANSTGDRKTLAACVSERCRGVCERAPATSSSRCIQTKFGYGNACACTQATADVHSNRAQCRAEIFPNTVCCAPPSWPSAGNVCVCSLITCNAVRGGCKCFLSDAFDPSATHYCDGDVCCQKDDQCRCGTRACDSDEKAVDACGLGTLSCPAGTTPVDDCSLP